MQEGMVSSDVPPPAVLSPVRASGRARPRAGIIDSKSVGALVGSGELSRKAGLPANVSLDLSFLEFEDSFATALKLIRPEQLLFGTCAPVHYPKASAMKIARSSAPERSKRMAFSDNAERLLKLSPGLGGQTS